MTHKLLILLENQVYWVWRRRLPRQLKWEIASKNPADQKNMICNADEGDLEHSWIVPFSRRPAHCTEAMAIGGFVLVLQKD